MSFFEAVASQRNAWRSVAAAWAATLLWVFLFWVGAQIQASNSLMWAMIWMARGVEAVAVLALLQSLLPSPVRWGRTLLALLLVAIWALAEWVWYGIMHAPMTKLW